MSSYETCAACDGPTYILGTLGKRAYLRCRNCGLDSQIRHDSGEGEEWYKQWQEAEAHDREEVY